MAKKPAKPNLSYIHEGLRGLAMPIGELVPDPANARAHASKNLAAIRGSLSQYGQRRPAVVQREGMIVRAGNGMLQCAIELGWSHLACILVDEDNVSAIGFAIADNRTAELATWDKGVLSRLMAEVEVGNEDLSQTFADLSEDLGLIVLPDEDVGDEAAPEPEPPKVFMVEVDTKSAEEQTELSERLTKEGFKCRAISA